MSTTASAEAEQAVSSGTDTPIARRETISTPDRLLRGSFVVWILIPGVLLAAAAMALQVDLPLAKFCDGRDYPGFIRHILDNAEPFGDAYGLLLIVAGIFLVDPLGRSRLPWIIASGLCAGLAADGIKLLISRTRPQSFDLDVTDISRTFNEWLPFSNGGSALQSFPSAHTAVAVGFAVALCRFYPRGRVLFIAMAVMCGMQRVQTCAHFLSDVLVGAAVGWVISHLILDAKWCPDGPVDPAAVTPEGALS